MRPAAYIPALLLFPMMLIAEGFSAGGPNKDFYIQNDIAVVSDGCLLIAIVINSKEEKWSYSASVETAKFPEDVSGCFMDTFRNKPRII
jgi:hypothetical protein